MSLAHSTSLKEFSLLLVASELRFSGVPLNNPRMVYEDFISVVEDIARNVRSKKKITDFHFYFDKKRKDITFQFDSEYDWRKFFELMRKINIINSSCGGVNDIAVGINIDAIYEFVGEELNENDEYFKVLEILWEDFMLTEPEQEKIDDKIKRLKHSFVINEQRIESLKNPNTVVSC